MKYLFLVALLIVTYTKSYSQITSSFDFEGVNRSYIVYTPSSYTSGDVLPLVFVLHGFTQSAQSIMDVSGFNLIADTANFIVVYPNGEGNAWNTNSGFPGGSTANDLGFIAALKDTIFSRYGVDTNRVYSCGFSAGGFMSHRLACESSQCFAAIASVAGTMSAVAIADCSPTRAVPVLQIHGTADAVVAYNGGFGGVAVDDVINKWITNNGCTASPIITQLPDVNQTDNSTVESNEYLFCSDASKVKLLKVVGGGHQWPGTSSVLGGLGNLNQDINASAEIWGFFRNFTCNTIPSAINTDFENEMNLSQIDLDHYSLQSTNNNDIAIFLFDLNGKIISGKNIKSNEIIDLTGLPQSLYQLVVYSKMKTYRYKLIH